MTLFGRGVGRSSLGRIVSVAAGLSVLGWMTGSMAFGYYNFVYFTSRNAPFTPVPVRFDYQNGLVGSTVSYFISDQPPAAMMPGDSYTGIVSQIRSAAAVWNGISTSALRLSYGGVSTVGTPQTTPGIDIVFNDDMPVGLLAQTRVTTPSDVSFLAGGASTFVPLLRSTVQLRSNLTATVGSVQGQSSYSELFYTTLVHEFGHALGLQHSLVSGAMSTYVTRATTKGHPLTADDIAAVSMLYPATGYLTSVGSINGKVLLASSGTGVNLASVVALSTNGTAISALTNPDGTYTISGVPAGQYYVYAHPLPPAQQGEAYPDNVVPPVDLSGNPFPAVTTFGTLFYPGTRDWTQAGQVTVNAGATVPNINFTVQASAGPAVYNLQTYVYQGAGGQIPVPSPYITPGSRQYMVFTANGATVNGTSQLTPGLSVSAIGTAAHTEPATLAYYQQGFLYEVIDGGQVSSSVPVALAVTTNTDLYVLPAGVTVTPNAPPTVTSVNGTTDGLGNSTVNVAGANLSPATEVLFDGTAATVVQQNNDGSLTVTAPVGSGGYTAFVEAVNSDGQSSAQALGSAQPAVFTYGGPSNPSISLTTNANLVAGADQVIEIAGVNAEFVAGQAAAGFASSDIQVNRTWVVDPQHIWADVTVNPQASPGPFTVSVQSGLQLVTLTGVLQVQALNPQQISLRWPAVNLATNLPGVPAGGVVAVGMTGLPANTNLQSLTGWTLTIGGVKAALQTASQTQIQAQVPNPLPLGAELIHLVPPAGDTIPQLAMQVDASPPDITNVTGPSGQPANATAVGQGDLITATVFNLGADPSIAVTPATVNVMLAGVTQTITALNPAASPGTFIVQFNLSGNMPAGQNSLTVGIGTRRSAPFSLMVHN